MYVIEDIEEINYFQVCKEVKVGSSLEVKKNIGLRQIVCNQTLKRHDATHQTGHFNWWLL